MQCFCTLMNFDFYFFGGTSRSELPTFNRKLWTSTTNVKDFISLNKVLVVRSWSQNIHTVSEWMVANSSEFHIDSRSAPEKIGHNIDIIGFVNALITTKYINLRIHWNCCEKRKFLKFLIFWNFVPVIATWLKDFRAYWVCAILSTTLKSRYNHGSILATMIHSSHCASIMTTRCHTNSTIKTSVEKPAWSFMIFCCTCQCIRIRHRNTSTVIEIEGQWSKFAYCTITWIEFVLE